MEEAAPPRVTFHGPCVGHHGERDEEQAPLRLTLTAFVRPPPAPDGSLAGTTFHMIQARRRIEGHAPAGAWTWHADATTGMETTRAGSGRAGSMKAALLMAGEATGRGRGTLVWEAFRRSNLAQGLPEKVQEAIRHYWRFA